MKEQEEGAPAAKTSPRKKKWMEGDVAEEGLVMLYMAGAGDRGGQREKEKKMERSTRVSLV